MARDQRAALWQAELFSLRECLPIFGGGQMVRYVYGQVGNTHPSTKTSGARGFKWN